MNGRHGDHQTSYSYPNCANAARTCSVLPPSRDVHAFLLFERLCRRRIWDGVSASPLDKLALA